MIRGEATIVIPSLDLARAAVTGAVARASAGTEAYVVIVSDFARRGGIRAANAGFRAGIELETPYVVYLNDDTTFPKTRWLARLIDALEEEPTYGIACPSGGGRGNSPQERAGMNEPPGTVVVDAPLVWGCAVMKRAMLVEIGLFDPILIHYAGDSDLTRRAQAAGWKSVWVRDAYVGHEGNTIDVAWKRRDKGIYLKRWGR